MTRPMRLPLPPVERLAGAWLPDTEPTTGEVCAAPTRGAALHAEINTGTGCGSASAGEAAGRGENAAGVVFGEELGR
jgi:hypothetical protein